MHVCAYVCWQALLTAAKQLPPRYACLTRVQNPVDGVDRVVGAPQVSLNHLGFIVLLGGQTEYRSPHSTLM